jgi:lipopolysaccharide assembly protein A
MQILVFFSLLIAILAVGFAVQNAGATTVQFLVWKFQTPLAVALLVAMALGALISLFASSPSMVRSKNTIRKQKKQVTELESSLAKEKARLTEAEKKITDTTAMQASLAEAQQKIQILEGRLALASKKPGQEPPA